MLNYLMTQASLKQRRKVSRMVKETSVGATSKTDDMDDENNTDNEDSEAGRMEVLFNEDLEP